MSLFDWAFKSSAELGESELPNIYPMPLEAAVFTKSDIFSTYSKILTDTLERTHGLKEKVEPLLWDNCVQSESAQGLVSLLACAMTDKSDLFLVYEPAVGVLRKATGEEEEKIKADYKATSSSKLGTFISFKQFYRTEMLLIYSLVEYSVLCSLHKTVNLAKAVQVKVSKLRDSVSLTDSEIAKAQAMSIAKALGRGSDIMLDAEDMIETAAPDVAPTEKAIAFLDAKRAFILGLPMSYISGIQTGGIGSTGEADMRAVERGLKQYYSSIIRPTLKAIFNANTEFKSQDFRELNSALEAVKTFDLVSNEFLSTEAKQEILARIFDLDPEEEKKNLEADAAQAESDAVNQKADQNQNQQFDKNQVP